MLSSKNMTKSSLIEDLRSKFAKLLNKKNIFFTKRCNNSIDLAIVFLKKLNFDSLLIQDQGGWMHYEKLAKRFSFREERLSTKNGILSRESLKKIKYSDEKEILLIHSRPGYIYDEDMEKIFLQKNKNVVLINDCSGSVGTELAKFGEIVVCSFGNFKPISCGVGGLIGFNDDVFDDVFENINKEVIREFMNDLKKEEKAALEIIDLDKLLCEVNGLEVRLKFWNKIANNLKKELRHKGFNVLNYKNAGINVLVSFDNLSEQEKLVQKERLIKYLDENNLQYTLCPRYIRSNVDGISIEIKKI